jgi:8-oxo-dGTP diphosphatase
MTETVHPCIEVAAAVIVKEGRLLLVRKRDTSTFMLPGGKPGAGEGDLGCLARELEEELGATPGAALELFGSFEADAANEPGRRVMARVYRLCLMSEPRASGEIEELLWYDFGQPAAGLALAPLVVNCIAPRLRRSA